MKVSNNTPSNVTQNAESLKSSKTSGLEAALDTKKTNGKTTASAAELSASSQVDVSSRAQEMRKAKELATPSDDVDEAKVARLQALIDSGKYKVDSEAIADRLLDEHSKMPL
jgi:flagellar biosynthesis anti-sigma factor FlgM